MLKARGESWLLWLLSAVVVSLAKSPQQLVIKMQLQFCVRNTKLVLHDGQINMCPAFSHTERISLSTMLACIYCSTFVFSRKAAHQNRACNAA